jgi:hypothetical protein
MATVNEVEPQMAPASEAPRLEEQTQSMPAPNDVVDQFVAATGEQEKDDATGQISGVAPAELANYATDPEVLEEVRSVILPYIKLARDNRQSKVEQDWIRYRDIYNLRRTVSYYEGRSKLFIPAIKKAIDVLTRVSKEAIFSDPYLGIETDIPKYKDTALELMKWLLEDQAKIKDKMSMFLRQLFQIGTSCLKLSWKKQQRTVKYREFNHDIGQTEIKTRNQFDYYGPQIEVIDMRHVYVWPETCVDYDNLRVVFEDSTIRTDELLDKVDEELYDAQAVLDGISRRSTTLETQRLSESQASREGLGDVRNLPKDVLDVTYVWAKFKLPGQVSAQWNQIILLNDNPNDIIRIGENPWWFQKPNYLFGCLFQEHDYFYGHGIVEMLEMWQYMVNDIANQTMDTGTFTLNPIVAFDPAGVDDPDQLELMPMAKWPINPKQVEIIRPPVDMAQNGQQFIQFLMNIIQESSDATALVQGAPRTGLGQATSTATGVSQLFAASNAAIIDQVDTLQSQVLTPLAHMVEIMAHEFMDEEMVIRKLGADGVTITKRVISPQSLMLSTDVRWIASNRLREKAAKIQQLINFFNIVVKIPPQMTQQQGFSIDFKEIVRDIYSGLGLPNTDRVIRDVTSAMPGIPPEFEQELIDAGRAVYASPVDLPENHQAHLHAHMMYRPKSELSRVRMMEHIANHYQAMQQGQAMLQAMTQGQGKGAPGSGMVQAGDRPQEQPQTSNESDALSGVLSQLGLG